MRSATVHLLVVLAVVFILLTTWGLWDGWMNHGTQSTYCLPFCYGGAIPNYQAGDLLVTVIAVGTIALAWLALRRKR